jgi:hypothetical protein
MANEVASNRPDQTPPRSAIVSYDSEYEFSIDRYVDVRLLVDDADKQVSDAPATYASAH